MQVISASTNIKQFQQPDPLHAIERLMQQLVDSGRAQFATVLVTDCDGRQHEISVSGTKQ